MKQTRNRRNNELMSLSGQIKWMANAGIDPVKIVTYIHLQTDRILNGSLTRFATRRDVHVSKCVRDCANDLRIATKSDSPMITNHNVNHVETGIVKGIDRIIALFRIRDRIHNRP